MVWSSNEDKPMYIGAMSENYFGRFAAGTGSIASRILYVEYSHRATRRFTVRFLASMDSFIIMMLYHDTIIYGDR